MECRVPGRASNIVGVVWDGTPPLVDVDLLVLGAHLDARRAAVTAAFDLVIRGERDNLAALRAAVLTAFNFVIRGERDNLTALRAGKDRWRPRPRGAPTPRGPPAP